MRLLSFLTEVERAITACDGSAPGTWQTARMVNFQQGLARLTLADCHRGRSAARDGAIFVQAFALADGSFCLKASLTWKGSDAFPSISVYTKPTVDWALEAERVATAWLEGPPVALSSAATETSDDRLVARAG